MKLSRLAYFLPLAALSVFVSACDEDAPELKKGVWRVVTTISAAGTQSTCADFSTQSSTQDIAICSGLTEIGEDDECVRIEGNSISYDCVLTDTEGSCTTSIALSGEGEFTETTFDFTYLMQTTISGSEPICGQVNNVCTLRTRLQGSFRSESGCSASTDAIGLLDLVRSVAITRTAGPDLR